MGAKRLQMRKLREILRLKYARRMGHRAIALGGDWVRCNWPEKNWDSYGDDSTTPSTYIHRKAQFWIHAGKSRLIFLLLYYQSEDARFRKVPDNTSQQVIVIEYLIEDLAAEIERQRLECEVDVRRPTSG